MSGLVEWSARLASLPARTTLGAADAVRQFRGRGMDLLGLGAQQSPARILAAGPTFRVRSFQPVADPAPPLLLVAAPIKRAYIWDLTPEASTVRLLTESGFAVHLLEWLDPDPSAADNGLAAYADTFLGQAVGAVREDSGEAPVLIGHSLGGTLAAIHAARHPQQVSGAVLLEAPLHFGADAGAFAPLVAASPDARWLQTGLGLAPGSFLNLVSVVAAPREFVVERHLDLLSSMGRSRLALHLRVHRWTLDELPMPGRLLAEIVEQLYRDDRFLRGDLTIGGRRVGPEDVVVPLLNVVNPGDAVIPPESVVPFHHAAASPVKALLRYHGEPGVALQHVGVLVGGRARLSLWPRIIDWIRDHGHTRAASSTGPRR